MKLTTTVWVIVLTRDTSGVVEPKFYYNTATDSFVREATKDCYFVSEKEAQEACDNLCTSGTSVMQGTLTLEGE